MTRKIVPHHSAPAGAQSGQILVLFALALVIVTGIAALAVDLGLAYHQRQQQQNTAVSAAQAGAYDLYGYSRFGTPTPGGSITADQQVFSAMRDIVESSGLTVMNKKLVSGIYVYQTPVADPCSAGYNPSQVYLQAQYLNAQRTPIAGQLVGSTSSLGPNARGVKVLGLGGCSPGFFARVLGRKSFIVSADALSAPALTPSTAGSVPTIANSGVPLATPTNTIPPTLTATATSAIPTATPTADTVQTFDIAPFFVYAPPTPGWLYGQNGPGYTGAGTGDVVTLVENGWTDDQYASPSAAKSGSPNPGISSIVHDQSMKGCLNTDQTTVNVGLGLDFNHGGLGNCGQIPNKGETVTIPLVYEIHKNDGSCSSNGGYCEVVTAIVQVYIPSDTSKQLVQGIIVGVVYDPYHIVVLPPTPTLTPTVTATPSPAVAPPA
jgi:hypothetical protein